MWRVLLVFTALDLLAILLYWFHLQDVLPSRFFRLARDRGFGECVQYLKYAAILFMLVKRPVWRPSKLITAWIILFSMLLLDDALGLHEVIGKCLAALFGLETLWGKEAKDIFELAGFALVEGLPLLYVAYCHLQAGRDQQRYSLFLFIALLPLIFAGMVLDALPWYHAETLGQMAGATIVLVYVQAQFKRWMVECREGWISG